jgi:hypothetical protein
VTLDAEDIEAVARRVVEMLTLEAPPPGAMIDAKAKALQLGMCRDDVYRKAVELGGVKIGARWRFPAEPPKQPSIAPATSPRVRARMSRGSVPLLPVRG